MKIDVATFVLASALSVSSGAWVGYKMSVAARAALREAPTAPPIEIAVVPSEVGTLVLKPTTVYGTPRPRAASVFPLPLPLAEPSVKFFDFHHAYCDEAEGTHGKVLRCQKLPR